MKSTIAAAVFAVAGITALGLTAQPENLAMLATPVEPRVNACLEIAELARSAAMAAKRGVSEDDIIKTAKESGSAVLLAATRDTLAVGAPPDVARSLAYAKCTSGGFGVLA